MSFSLTIALPKGRLLAPALEVLRGAGIDADALEVNPRKLVVQDSVLGIKFLVARPADVPTYVEYGAADLGIVGKDILMEEDKEVYELLDLGKGFCRFVVAGTRKRAAVGLANGSSGIRVATKFPRVAEEFFRKRGVHAEIIKLHGNTELAPLVGLSEVIVDLVSTGQTLAENGLVIMEEIATATARLIANPVSYRLKAGEIDRLIRRMRAALENGGDKAHA